MSATTAPPVTRSRPTDAQPRAAAVACIAAGVLGMASGIYLAVVTPQVAEGQYSYPLTAAGFVAIQIWFAVHHLGLLAGQYGLKASGVAGGGAAVRRGHWLGLGGMALLTLTEVLATTAANEPYPGPVTGVLDALYGVASVAIGAGLLAVGLGVRREGAWRGWRAIVPLAIGAWVFVPMMPALMAGHLAARLSISGWMLLYALLGWALLQPAGPSTRTSRNRGRTGPRADVGSP